MAAPANMPTWATDTNYTSGNDIGLATRLAPTTGEKAEGLFRGKRAPARKLNWILGLLCDWVAFLELSRVEPRAISIPTVVSPSANITAITNPRRWFYNLGPRHARLIFYAEVFSVNNTTVVTWDLDLPSLPGSIPNITQEYQVLGSGVAVSGTTGASVPIQVIGKVATGRATCSFISPLAANYKIRLSFDYSGDPYV